MIDNRRFNEFLVVNCGKNENIEQLSKNNCSCPSGYVRVKDTGEWNLNSGTEGDLITLCYALKPKSNSIIMKK